MIALPLLIPPTGELAGVFVGPFHRHMVRGVRRAGREVHEERLARANAFWVRIQSIAWSARSSVR